MGMEYFGDDAESGIAGTPEKASESSRSKAGSGTLAGIARTQKDEAKGRKASSLLFALLSEILKNPKFDPILEPVFSLLHANIPSAQVLAIVSLVSIDAANAIRTEFDPKAVLLKSEPPVSKEPEAFDSAHLRPDLKVRINEWIEDVFRVSVNSPSSILAAKFLLQVSGGTERKAYLEALSAVVSFFFHSKNVRIPESEAAGFARYLLSELQKRMASLELEFME